MTRRRENTGEGRVIETSLTDKAIICSSVSAASARWREILDSSATTSARTTEQADRSKYLLDEDCDFNESSIYDCRKSRKAV